MAYTRNPSNASQKAGAKKAAARQAARQAISSPTTRTSAKRTQVTRRTPPTPKPGTPIYVIDPGVKPNGQLRTPKTKTTRKPAAPPKQNQGTRSFSRSVRRRNK